MKTFSKLILSTCLVLPLALGAQQPAYPAGTVPNEHNITEPTIPASARTAEFTSAYSPPTPRKLKSVSAAR